MTAVPGRCGTSAHFSKFVFHRGTRLFTNFEKSRATHKLMILVPLFYLKFLNRFGGLWNRNFK
jgi:hypothetical protein